MEQPDSQIDIDGKIRILRACGTIEDLRERPNTYPPKHQEPLAFAIGYLKTADHSRTQTTFLWIHFRPSFRTPNKAAIEQSPHRQLANELPPSSHTPLTRSSSPGTPLKRTNKETS